MLIKLYILLILSILLAGCIQNSTSPPSCEESPREDELCKCEEKRNLTEMNCLTGESFGKKEFCTKSRPKSEFELYPNEYTCKTWEVTFRNFFNETNNIYWYTNEALNYKLSSFQEVLNDIKSKECIEWINKTECEKENPDWVEENKSIGFINSGEKSIGILYQTICREKTDVEKLMDRDCIVLFNEICLTETIGQKANYLEAWRQKECRI